MAVCGVSVASPNTIRESQRELMARRRAAERDIEIPPVVNQERRDACEHNDALWLQTYLPRVFYNPFTADQLATIADAGNCLRYGISKCKAAPRGDGKSSILKYLTLKYALYRQIRFVLLICATGPKSDDSLKSIKDKLRAPRGEPLADDFPFECAIARYVAPAPARANNATVDGGKTIRVEWAANRLMLPTLVESREIGPIIMSLGYESDQLQGCNVYDIRPDFVLLDDLDSRESLAAVDGTIAGKIETIIDQTVGGLGGPGRRLGQFYLGTVTSRTSAAYKYSDPQAKPAWSGTRTPRIRTWPERMDLWEEYTALRHNGQQTRLDPNDATSGAADPFGREAHAYYVAHRGDMDAGADLSNIYDFDQDKLPDGTPKHLSALQKCFDYISDKGMESFLTEHQNDPPEQLGPLESGITPHLIQRKVNGLDRRQIPEGTIKITRGVDVRKVALHWVVRAWMQDGTPYTVDYGVHEVHGTKYGSDEGLDVAIRRSILSFLEESSEWYSQPIDRTLIDARWRTDAIYGACLEAGLGVQAVIGHGKSAGCAQANFHDVLRGTQDRKPGDGWFLTRKGRLWLVNADADRWKAWEHDRWMTKEGAAGCLTLFGCKDELRPEKLSADEKGHHSYAHHICSEVEVEEPYKGVMRRRWKPKSTNNHWLDASYYSDVAASIEGVPIIGAGARKLVGRRTPAGERPSAADLANRSRRSA